MRRKPFRDGAAETVPDRTEQPVRDEQHEQHEDDSEVQLAAAVDDRVDHVEERHAGDVGCQHPFRKRFPEIRREPALFRRENVLEPLV